MGPRCVVDPLPARKQHEQLRHLTHALAYDPGSVEPLSVALSIRGRARPHATEIAAIVPSTKYRTHDETLSRLNRLPQRLPETLPALSGEVR
jgi:hypothetical protein